MGGTTLTRTTDAGRRRSGVESRGYCCAATLRGFVIRLAERTGGGHTSKGRVGTWSDHRRGARPVDRDDGCPGLGRRHGLRVRCCDCAREDGRGDPRGNAHPASWPQLLRAPATRSPPRALTPRPAPSARRWRQNCILALPHVLPEPRTEATAHIVVRLFHDSTGSPGTR